MAERVGEIEVYADLNDRDLIAGLKKVDAALEREKAKIERDHAEWKIDVDVKDLERKLKEANRKLEEAEREATETQDKAERKRAQNRASYQRQRIKAIEEEARAERQRQEAQKRGNKELEFTERRVAAVEKAEAARAREFEKAEKRRQAELRRTATEEARLARQRESDARAQERIRTKEDRDAQRAHAAREKELAQIPTMRRQYAELQRTIEKLSEARRRTHDPRSQGIIDLKVDEAVAKAKALNKTLERVGSPVDWEVDLHPGRDMGLTIRRILGSNPGLAAAAVAGGRELGAHFSKGFRDKVRDTRETGLSGLFRNVAGRGTNVALGGLARVNKMLQSLSEATIRLGPFTSSIRQAIVGLSLFAPIILDVVGALGSLVSVVGSATVGAVGVATAGFGAFGAVLGSTGLLLIPLMRDFKNLNTMQSAYHKQVLKTGANSDKAKTKLQEFNHAMGAVPESTKQAFLGINKLQDQFRGLSHAARPAFLTTIAEGLRTTKAFLGQFGQEMVQSFNLVSHGIQVMFKGLRSQEAQNFFQTMFDQGQAALPAFARAMGNLARSVANVAKSFSMVLPSLGGGFEAWTKGILTFTQNGQKMQHLVDSTVKSMRDLGHFTQATARFLTVFFSAGTGAGQGFLVTMTNALNRWSEFLSTTKGRNDLQQFFTESVHGAQVFWASLQPILVTFTRWAAMIAPWARMFFSAASGVTQLVAQFLRLTGLQGPISALVTTLGVLWGIGKVGAATQAIIGFTRALLGLAGAEKAVAAANVEGGIAGALGGGRAGSITRSIPFIPMGMKGGIASTLEKDAAAAAKTGGRFAILRAGTAGLTGAFATFAETATGPVGLGLAAATYGAYKLYAAHAKLNQSVQNLLNNDDRLNNGIELQNIRTKDLAGTATQLAQAHLTEQQAQRTVNTLRDHGKAGTEQYRQALINLRYAQQQLSDAQTTWTDQSKGVTDASNQQIEAAKANIAERQKERDSIKTQIEDAKRQGVGMHLLKGKYDELRTANQALRGEQEILAQAQARATIGAINQQRAMRMLPPIAMSAMNTVKQLNQELGKGKVQKIGLKFPDPRQAAKVMSSLNKTIQSGTPKNRAFNVVANSKNAEQALRRLNQIRLTPKRLEIIEKGGALAVRMIEKITGEKIPKKLVPIVEQGGPKAMAVLRDIFGFHLPKKTQNIQQVGGPGVLGMLGNIIRKKIPNKTFAAILHDLASSGIRGIIGALSGLHDKTVTVTTVTRHVGGGSFKIAKGGASGAVMSPDEKKANNIPANMSEKTFGGMYQKPTFLVGEEKRPEFVIATNPAYRQKNIAYWMDAAKALGIPGFATGFSGSGYYAPTDVAPVPKNKTHPMKDKAFNKKLAGAKKGGWKKNFTKTRRNLHRSLQNDDLSSVNYVKTLQTQADDLDREYSIREMAQMAEPETFLREVGKDENGDSLYEIDQGALQAFADSFNPLIEVKDALVTVFANLVKAIPQALAQLVARKQHAQLNAATLSRDIKLTNARIAAEQKHKKPNQDKIKALRARLADDKSELSFTTKLGESAQSDINDLQDDRKEAGFSWREETINASALRADQSALTGTAQQQLTDANPKADTGGGSGGGGGANASDTLTYGQQAALADASNRVTLRDFGSNFQAIGAMFGANVSPGAQAFGMGQGMQANPAALTGLNPTTNTTNLGSALAGSGSGGILASRSVGAVSGPGVVTASGGGDTNVTVNNTFASVPPDPHTWSQGVAFELGAAI